MRRRRTRTRKREERKRKKRGARAGGRAGIKAVATSGAGDGVMGGQGGVTSIEAPHLFLLEDAAVLAVPTRARWTSTVAHSYRRSRLRVRRKFRNPHDFNIFAATWRNVASIHECWFTNINKSPNLHGDFCILQEDRSCILRIISRIIKTATIACRLVVRQNLRTHPSRFPSSQDGTEK